MVAIPKKPADEIVSRVYEAIRAEQDSDLRLSRLGASGIGEECLRRVWMSWRGYDKSEFDGRMLRLFGTGHWQEDRIVGDLCRAGLKVWDKDEKTGLQYTFVDDTRHFVAKLDGVVTGVPGNTKAPHVLEIKTHNKNSFSALVKHGLRSSKPSHYAQIQSGMWLSGMSNGLYVAVCKDDEQFYVEIVKVDKEFHVETAHKVIKLVEATMRPAGISADASSFGCKYCDMKSVCVGEKPPLRTCRSCRYVLPVKDGTWVCTVSSAELSLDEQLVACEEYTQL